MSLPRGGCRARCHDAADNACRTLFFPVLVFATMLAAVIAGTAVADDDADDGDWRDEFQTFAKRGLLNVEDFADTSWRRFSRRMGFDEPRQIHAYSGYGNERHVWVRGRVLANKPIGGPGDDDSWWDNLRATYERWETDEVAGVDVQLAYGDARQTVTTDDEGYYHARFDADARYPHDSAVFARYVDDDTSLAALHRIALPGRDARYMVISDVDDTVIHTGITDVLLAAKLTFLNNAKTRKPLAGVAGLYRELAGGEDSANPIFYLSNSGWNMYDLLRDFIDLNDIPWGPLLLRDLGLHDKGEGTTDHKANTLRELLLRYPHLPAILIGDSGQHDAALYADIAREFPDRIIAIYIRDIDPDEDSAYDSKVDAIIDDNTTTGVPMLRGRDSDSFAAHLREIGILEADEQQAVAGSVTRDKGRETILEE